MAAKRPPAKLQTIIIKKGCVPGGKAGAARKAARVLGHKPTTSRETGQSYRFRARPPGQFKKESFRTKKIGKCVTLVVGRMK